MSRAWQRRREGEIADEELKDITDEHQHEAPAFGAAGDAAAGPRHVARRRQRADANRVEDLECGDEIASAVDLEGHLAVGQCRDALAARRRAPGGGAVDSATMTAPAGTLAASILFMVDLPNDTRRSGTRIGRVESWRSSWTCGACAVLTSRTRLTQHPGAPPRAVRRLAALRATPSHGPAGRRRCRRR